MAERVVDLLEVVEIEAQHGELLALARPGDRRIHVVLKQHAVRRPVSASWCAMKPIRCSFRRFSVTSSKVTTVPPLAIGSLAIRKIRSGRTSISTWVDRRVVNCPMISAQTASGSLSGYSPRRIVASTISGTVVPGPTLLGGRP